MKIIGKGNGELSILFTK